MVAGDPYDTTIEYEDYDEEDDDSDGRRPLAVISTLILLLVVFFLVWLFLQRTVIVPDVVGMSDARARAVLEAAGLKAGDITSVRHAEETSVVVGQSPATGLRVKPKSVVDLTVSRGLGGVAEDDASTNGGWVVPKSDFNPLTGETLEEEPEEDPPLLSATYGPWLPSVLSMTEDEARSTLEGAGFNPVFKSGPSTTSVSKGLVYAQVPEPGSDIPKGTDVEVWLSTGPPGPWPFSQPSY